MKIPEVNILDFETSAIGKRPFDYPPAPVGFSLQHSGEQKSTYYSWGHPAEYGGNNCTKIKAGQILRDVWRSELPVLCHNYKFDCDVAETHFGLPPLPWTRFHDTMFLLFLSDPFSNLSLKPSAERVLGLKPRTRDRLKEWILENVKKAKQSDWGAYISLAPAALVADYAKDDVRYTLALFRKLYPEIVERGMLPAYQRELRLLPILLRTEREGIQTDLRSMERDYPVYLAARERVDNWLRKRLGVANLNLDADKDVGNAFFNCGIIAENNWAWTAGSADGKRAPQLSVAKKNMPLTIFEDKQVASAYGYRGRLSTALSFFMEPWLEMARASSGVIQTVWNQVRQNHGSPVGARSGRLSSTPPFLNISKNFETKTDGYTHPTFLRNLPHLPLMRSYLLPDKGGTWGHRDINQQELRLLAHFAPNPELAETYNRQDALAAAKNNPKLRLDVHSIVHDGIVRILGLDFERTKVKTFDFQNVYGGGITAAMVALDCDRRTAKQVIRVLMQVLPGYEELLEDCKARGDRAIRTWGGREYHCEKPAFSKKYKRPMTFEYKRLNYLIQPSAADVTKEIIVRYNEHPKREARFLLAVHDELNSSMPKKRLREEMSVLQECIESIETDVKMVSDGKTGKNWGSLVVYKDPKGV